MDPVTMTTLAVAGTALSAGATVLGSVAQSKAMKAQAAADQNQAAVEAQWADRRAKEERAAAQRAAGQQTREGKLAQSRLQALSAASGSGPTDPTVMNLWGGIEKEAQINAANETAAGEQKAAGLKYSADLGTWAADANAAIKRSSAKSTLIGGLLSAGGQGLSGLANAGQSRMALRYSDPALGSQAPTYRYG